MKRGWRREARNKSLEIKCKAARKNTCSDVEGEEEICPCPTALYHRLPLVRYSIFWAVGPRGNRKERTSKRLWIGTGGAAGETDPRKKVVRGKKSG